MASYVITGAASGSYTEQNRTLDGFYVSSTATTPGDTTIAQMEAVTINVSLYRKGNPVQTIVAGPVFPLVAGTCPGSLGASAVAIGGSGFSGRIDLGGVLQLDGDDMLQVNINVGGTPATGAVFTISTSYCVGIESYTPRVNCYSIQKTRTTEPVSGGSYVNGIALVNTSTDYVITDCSVTSDNWSNTFTSATFDSCLGQAWEVTPIYWGFQIYNDVELNNVDLTCTIDTGASGNGYVIVWGGQQSAEIRQRARKTALKVAQKLNSRF